MKRDKKILDKEIENQMDREFEKRGIKTRVYHFTENVEPFRAVTILEYSSPSYSHARRALDAARILHYYHSQATKLLNGLHEQGIWGVAICDKRDTFNRQEGRCRAKRRLLRHLKKRGEIPKGVSRVVADKTKVINIDMPDYRRIEEEGKVVRYIEE